MFDRRLKKGACPIGLDCGTHSIKAIQLMPGPQGYEVIAAVSRALPADLPERGPSRVHALSSVVSAMINSTSFIGRRVVTCMPANEVQYKNVRLPKMPADELAQAVQWEANDRLRVGDEGFVAQFFDAGEVRQGEDVRQEIIVMAAPNPAIDEHLNVLVNSDLDPLAIDAVPGALARLIRNRFHDGPEAGARVLLDVGYASSKVLITRGGRVVFFKLIDIGGRRMDEAVAERLDMSLHDAAQLRRNLNQPADESAAQNPLFGATRRENTERAVNEALRSAVGDLVREVGLCLRYYSVTFRGRRPESLAMIGGEGQQKQLAAMLSEGADISVQPLSVFDGIGVGKIPALHSATDLQGHWGVALGLSMRTERSGVKRGAA